MLHHSSQKPSFEDFFDSNPLPTWIYEIETLRFLAVNAAALAHYGYAREEFLSMTIKDIRPGEDVARLLENVTAVTDGLDMAGKWRHVKKNGAVIEVEIISHTLNYLGRKAEMVTAIDMTERNQAHRELMRQLQRSEEMQKELVESKALLSLVISSIPAGIACVDNTYRIQWVNLGFIDFFKCGDLPVRGLHVRDLAGERAWELIKPNLDIALSGKRHQYIAHLPYEKIGARWMRVTYTPEMDDQGRTRGAIVHMVDIDDIKKLEKEQVRSAQLAMIGQFASGVVHELNNPVNGIMNCAQILLNREAVAEANRDFLDLILRESQRISELTRTMLFFSRDETEQTVIDANDLCADVIKLVSKSLLHESIDLVFESSTCGLMVSVIPQRIEQVLLNLINNSQHALLAKANQKTEPKQIKLTLQHHSEANPVCRFSVFDNGTGIPACKLDQVCEPFVTTKQANEGTGLGLSISTDIVAEHGSSLHVSSVEGLWTRVTFDLPLKILQGHSSNN